MKENLHENLEALRAEIERLPPEDEISKKKLELLLEGLENKLDYPEEADHHLHEGIKDSITHFEVSHPRVTAILNDIMMALSNMGI